MAAINGYIVESEIARGIQGIVFSAKSRTGHRVVLKQLGMEEGKREHALIQRVAYANGKNVANVIRCVDAFEWEEDYFLVLESLAGTVRSFVHHKNVTPFALACVALGSIRGLAEIHRANLVHCDVKPDNFGVSRKSNRIVAFDLASAVRIGEENQNCSEYTSPPEVLIGKPSETSDTYAWARMIELEVTGKVGIGPRHLLSDIVPWVGKEFSELIRRCTAEAHGDRPDPIETAVLAQQALSTVQPRAGCQCRVFVDGGRFDCGH